MIKEKDSLLLNEENEETKIFSENEIQESIIPLSKKEIKQIRKLEKKASKEAVRAAKKEKPLSKKDKNQKEDLSVLLEEKSQEKETEKDNITKTSKKSLNKEKQEKIIEKTSLEKTTPEEIKEDNQPVIKPTVNDQLKEEVEYLKKIPLEKNKDYRAVQFARFEIYRDDKLNYRFRVVASNNEIIAHSAGFKSKVACKTLIIDVIKYSKAEIIDLAKGDNYAKLGDEVFELYNSADNKYRFRLKVDSSKVLLVSKGYDVKASCLKGITTIKNLAKTEKIVDLD